MNDIRLVLRIDPSSPNTHTHTLKHKDTNTQLPPLSIARFVLKTPIDDVTPPFSTPKNYVCRQQANQMFQVSISSIFIKYTPNRQKSGKLKFCALATRKQPLMSLVDTRSESKRNLWLLNFIVLYRSEEGGIYLYISHKWKCYITNHNLFISSFHFHSQFGSSFCVCSFENQKGLWIVPRNPILITLYTNANANKSRWKIIWSCEPVLVPISKSLSKSHLINYGTKNNFSFRIDLNQFHKESREFIILEHAIQMHRRKRTRNVDGMHSFGDEK